VDVERVQRINQTLSLIPEEKRTHSALRPIELLVIAPSQRLDAVAARHVGDLPAPVRTMLGALGVTRTWPTCAARRWPATCCSNRATPRS
jgi:NTE family protein